jgi:type I restriction enzyme S subunit
MMEEILPELPKGWVWAKLENCVDILDSQRVPINSKEREKRKGNIPYYGATGQVGWIDDFIFDEELILLGEDGAPFLDPYKPKAYIIRSKSWVNNHAHVLRAIFNLTTNAMLCYYLNIFDFHNYVTGTTRLKLNQSPMRQIPIPLPPLSEQHRIVNKIEELFTKLDAGVDALKKIKIQLKRYRQAVLKNAFEGKLTQQWREAHKEELEPASVLLEKIKEQRKKESKEKFKDLPPIDTFELSELPEGWVWTRLDYITQNITKGSTPTSYGFSYKKEGIKFIKTENIIEDGTIANIKDFIDEDANNFLKRSILQTYDILFSIAGTIGRVGLVQERDLPANTNQALSLIRLFSENIVNKYVFYFFKSPYIQKQSLKSIVGVGRANITLTDVSCYNIPLPPLLEQHQIVAEIESRLSVADQLEKVVEQSLKQAERLRQSILKQAFEGKLVPQDPTDEPAEKLLERIKKEKESKGLAKQKSGKRK